MKQRSSRVWLRCLAVAMMICIGMFGSPGGEVAAQRNPCVPWDGPGGVITNPENPNPTSTPLDLSAGPTPTPYVVGQTAGDQLAFAQIAGRPTETSDCVDPTPTEMDKTSCVRCEPGPSPTPTEPDESTCERCEPQHTPTVPDSCRPVVIITPDDPLTPTATMEPSVTPTEIIPTATEVIPTATEVIPTATDVIIPQGADVGIKLGFAQQVEDCETPSADDGSGEPDDGDDTGRDTGGDTGGDTGSDSGGSSVTGLPSTGAGASGTMTTVLFVILSGAGVALCAAAWLAMRKQGSPR